MQPETRRFASGWACLAIVVLALLGAVSGAAEQDSWSGVERIVAVGDVHGDYNQFVKLLQSAGVVDSRARWNGGKTHLVQTGDILDRGPDSRKVMDLLMRLEGEARRTSGRVHALLGNHEAMNLYGDLRYVSPGEYHAFSTPGSDDIRDSYYRQHIEELRQSPPAGGLPSFDNAYRRQWETKIPLGWVEHRMQFAPTGRYGKWLRQRNAVVKINDLVFLHGGIGPKYADHTIGRLNERVRSELEDFSKLPDGLVVDPEGPLWYRGLATEQESALGEHVDRVLKIHGAQRIVIGHTVTDGTIIPRFGGKVLTIDVGLSENYGSRQACLLIEQGRVFAVHRGVRLELPDDSGPGLLEYLRRAAALDPQPSPLERRIAHLEAGRGR